MAETTPNTQKIQNLLNNHPIALAKWNKSIEEQNDSTIRHAWRTTLKELLPPGTGRKVGISYQNVLTNLKKKKVHGLKEVNCKILLEIAGILQSLKIGKYKFGEKIELGSHNCEHKESVMFVFIYFATMTKTIDGFHVELKDDMGIELEDYYERRPITRNQAAE